MPPKKKAGEGRKLYSIYELQCTLDNHSEEQEGPTETPDRDSSKKRTWEIS